MKNIVNYAKLVKERHALNETIAPVEVDQTDSSRAYAVGDQLIYDGILYDVIDDIAQHGIITAEGAGANIRTADTIVEQIKNKTITTDAVPTQGSTNPVQSNGVYVENRNIYEVMGKMGAKALLPMSLADIKARHSAGTWNGNAYTINGITYTINTDSDGFITDIVVTGTASADATLTVYGYSYTSAYAKVFDVPVIASTDFVGSNNTARGIIWGSNSGYIDDTELQIAAGTIYGFGLRVVNGYEIPEGGITFKPMLRFASDTDSTYQPYAKTNKQLTAENEALTKELEDEVATRSALGAKNILPFDLAEIKALNTNGTWEGDVYTYRGVAFTVNSDGTISATGTATGGNASIKLFAASSNYEMLGKEVILTGCPSNGSASTYRIQAYRMASADGSTGTYFDDGAGTNAFTVLNNASGTVGSFAVAVYENATVTNLLFKPMVRLASDIDDTYQPYAMTNREMTPYVQAISNPNLLDNPFFTVNQRGITTYTPTLTTEEYYLDRWYSRGKSDEMSIANGYLSAKRIVLTANPPFLNQKIENALPAGTYTLSIKYKTNVIKSTKIYSLRAYNIDTNDAVCIMWIGNSLDWEIASATFTLDSDTKIYICLQDFGASLEVAALNDEIDIACIKLERGSISTLAMDTAPNYATELLKCQRYFVRLGNPNGNAQVGISQAINASELSSIIPISVPMRTNPTLTTDYTKVFARNGNTKTAITSVGNISVGGCNAIWCSFNGAFTTGTFYEIRLESNVLDFSAEL